MVNVSVDLEDFWPYQLAVLADMVNKHTLAILKDETHLNLSQWRVLVAVAEMPGRSAAEVVSITPMDKGIVSRAVASLIETGDLKKAMDPGDRRRSELYVTDKGQRVYDQVSQQLWGPYLSRDDQQDFNDKLHLYIAHMKSIKS